MQELRLPSFECKIRDLEGKTAIFDVIRKKYLILTPEEWVRQHVVHLLVSHLGYPASLIKLEGALTYETLEKRSDILVFDREAKPYLLVECKAPDVKLTQRTLEQASRYNKVIQAPYLVITNGMKTYCFGVDFFRGSSMQLEGLPPAPR